MTWSSSLLQWRGACGTTATGQGLPPGPPLDKPTTRLSTYFYLIISEFMSHEFIIGLTLF